MKKIQNIIAGIMISCCTLSVVHAEELTNKKMREIGESYIEAILSKDYAAWSSLMASTEGVSEGDFMHFYSSKDPRYENHYLKYGISNDIDKIKLKKTKGNFIILHIYNSMSDETKVALQLLPDGKIKYDTFFIRHPVIIAQTSVTGLYFQHERGSGNKSAAWKAAHMDPYIDLLIKSGVPLFDYNKSGASIQDKLRSLDKIREWLSENGNEWDCSKPELFIPKAIYSF